jgi:hypothetical protein
MSAPTLTIVTAGGTEVTTHWSAVTTADHREHARREGNVWIKRLRLVPYGTQTMRERFTYQGDSLWWFTELYLHKTRVLETTLLTVFALDAVRAQDAPARLVLSGADVITAAAARAWGAARGVAVDTPGAAPLSRALAARRREARTVGWSAYTARWGRRRVRPAPAARAAFVHTAFWREQDTYVGPVLDAVRARAGADALRLVGVGPRRTFAGGGGAAGADAPVTPIEAMTPVSALRGALALWCERAALADAVTRGDAIRDAARVHDVDLWPVLEHALRTTALVQWTWSAKAIDEMGAAIDALQCHTVVTYAEAGGVGRALVLAARRRGVRSVGLQHGFIYRHWLNYLHEPDEFAPRGDDRGYPVPDQTLLFDGYAAAHLRTAGHFPPDTLRITGSPRLDALAARINACTPDDRTTVRDAVGAVRPEQTLVVLAAKFSEIHTDLPALVDALRKEPDIHLVIKAHPAERADVYTPLVDGVYNITVAAADLDLAALLGAADLIVTKNSTVAYDGLALGIPALVIGLPNNLSPLVDAGVMAGTADRLRQSLRAVLYDQQVRDRLRDATVAFVAAHGLGATGTAAARAADVILDSKSQVIDR